MGSTHVSSLVGAGGLRFLVTYAPEKTNPAYVQFLVDVDDYAQIDDLLSQVEADCRRAFLKLRCSRANSHWGPVRAARSKPASAARTELSCVSWPIRR